MGPLKLPGYSNQMSVAMWDREGGIRFAPLSFTSNSRSSYPNKLADWRAALHETHLISLYPAYGCKPDSHGSSGTETVSGTHPMQSIIVQHCVPQPQLGSLDTYIGYFIFGECRDYTAACFWGLPPKNISAFSWKLICMISTVWENILRVNNNICSVHIFPGCGRKADSRSKGKI